MIFFLATTGFLTTGLRAAGFLVNGAAVTLVTSGAASSSLSESSRKSSHSSSSENSMIFFLATTSNLAVGLRGAGFLATGAAVTLLTRSFFKNSFSKQGLPTLLQTRPCQGRTHRRRSFPTKMWRRIKAKGHGYIKQTTS